MLYRILTETKENLEDIVSARFDEASIYHGLGIWKNVQEPSTAIELDDRGNEPESFKDRVYEAARAIGMANKQTAVLVQELPITSHLVSASEFRNAEAKV